MFSPQSVVYISQIPNTWIILLQPKLALSQFLPSTLLTSFDATLMS